MTITQYFTRDELDLIADACNSLYTMPEFDGYPPRQFVSVDGRMVPGMYGEVADGIRIYHLDQKYGVDGAALLRKLLDMPDSFLDPLIEALRKFWTVPNEYRHLEEAL
jgi:hypothetical protein